MHNSKIFPQYMSPYRSLFSDDEGRLFVMTYEERKNGGEYMWDIFDTEGCFINRVGLRNYANWDNIVLSQLVIIAKQNRMYCIQQKDNGYKELVVNKVMWSSRAKASG